MRLFSKIPLEIAQSAYIFKSKLPVTRMPAAASGLIDTIRGIDPLNDQSYSDQELSTMLSEIRSLMHTITGQILKVHSDIDADDDSDDPRERLSRLEAIRLELGILVARIKIAQALAHDERVVVLYRPEQARTVRDHALLTGECLGIGGVRAVAIVDELMSKGISEQAGVVRASGLTPVTETEGDE